MHVSFCWYQILFGGHDIWCGIVLIHCIKLVQSDGSAWNVFKSFGQTKPIVEFVPVISKMQTIKD